MPIQIKHANKTYKLLEFHNFKEEIFFKKNSLFEYQYKLLIEIFLLIFNTWLAILL